MGKKRGRMSEETRQKLKDSWAVRKKREKEKQERSTRDVREELANYLGLSVVKPSEACEDAPEEEKPYVPYNWGRSSEER